MNIDDTDKRLLKILQNDFPLVGRPFRHIATTLVLEESEVIERTRRLVDAGVIRRIGPLFNIHKFGYRTTLVALKVPEEIIEPVASFINEHEYSTHNYIRDDEYNLWFTFAYKNDAELSDLFHVLKIEYGINDILELPSTNTYKLKTTFYGN